MSDDKKTRRRFMADMLFAGGAVTAASVLGYVATHWKPRPEQQPVGAMVPCTPQPSPAVAPTPVEPEMLPDGDMIAPEKRVQTTCTPSVDLRPAGAPPPPNYRPPVQSQQGKRGRPARRDQ
jgi:hypothetical protein